MKKRLPAILTASSLLLIWQVSCWYFSIPDFLLPSPWHIGQAFLEVEMEKWWSHSFATLRVALAGFGLSALLSLLLSVLMVRFNLVQQSLYPILVVVQSTPIVAIAPLLIITLGTGDGPRIAITCLISFFPMVVANTTGMLKTPREFLELSQSVQSSTPWRAGMREFTHIRLPFAIPYIFSGLKVAITLAIVGAVVAEFVAAENGLGYFIQFSTSFYAIPQAFAGLLLLVGISVILFQLVEGMQKYFFAWSLSNKD